MAAAGRSSALRARGFRARRGARQAGAAWLLRARVCPTAGRRRRTSRSRAKLRRRPRSAGVAATSDRVARPIACPPGSNRPAVAFSCMHRGCGGQPSVLVLGSDRAEARCGVRRRSARWLGRGRRVEHIRMCACYFVRKPHRVRVPAAESWIHGVEPNERWVVLQR